MDVQTKDAPLPAHPVLDRISAGLMVVSAAAMLLMMLHTTLDVLLKYLAGRTVFATLEITSYYYMVAVCFLPLAHLQQRRGHIIVEVFTDHLGKETRRAMDGVVYLVAGAFMALMSWAAFSSAVKNTAARESVEIIDVDLTVWPSRWIAVVGCAAMCAYLLVQGVALLRRPFAPALKGQPS